MFGQIHHQRRRLLGSASMTMAVAMFGMFGRADAQSENTKPPDVIAIKPGKSASFGPLKQIDAGVLNVGYAEAGPADGRVVILLQ